MAGAELSHFTESFYGARRAQSGEFGFQFGNAPIARGECSRLEALRYVLRAVRVPRRNRKDDHALRPRFVASRHQFRSEIGIPLDDARLTPDFDTLPVLVVDQEQLRLGIFRKIPASPQGSKISRYPLL